MRPALVEKGGMQPSETTQTELQAGFGMELLEEKKSFANFALQPRAQLRMGFQQ